MASITKKINLGQAKFREAEHENNNRRNTRRDSKNAPSY